MISLADAIKSGIVKRPLNEDEQWATQDVLDAAAEWAKGTMPLSVFAEVGKLPAYDSRNRRIESAGYARCLALFTTPTDDPRRDALQRAIDALVDAQDVVRTRHGTFTRQSLHEAGVTVK